MTVIKRWLSLPLEYAQTLFTEDQLVDFPGADIPVAVLPQEEWEQRETAIQKLYEIAKKYASPWDSNNTPEHVIEWQHDQIESLKMQLSISERLNAAGEKTILSLKNEIERLHSVVHELNGCVMEERLAHDMKVMKLEKWIADLQSGMYVNCVYCGHRYGPKEDTPVAMADILKEHIEQCPKHPMSVLKAENEELKKYKTAVDYFVDDRHMSSFHDVGNCYRFFKNLEE